MSVIRIALVEDDPEARLVFAQWIGETTGMICCCQCSSAEEAVRQIPGSRPDVVLTDINLPGQSGIACVRHLKPLLPDTQFVMLTVYSDTQYLFDALAAGASGYLLKRISREDLITALRDVHSGSAPMSGSIARKVVQYFHRQEPAAGNQPESRLTNREREVLKRLARGDLYKEIADSFGISILTVNTHVRRIYEKLHVHSRAQAVAKYFLDPPAD